MKRFLMGTAMAMGLVLPGAVEAQSLFNSAGLGRPVDAVDGRARALGSFGIGLPGGSISPADPAAAGLLGLPSGLFAVQPSWVEASRDGADVGDFRGTRFPLVGIGYPLVGGMLTFELGSVLDQRFRGERVVTVELGGAPVDVTDTFTQEGGVSTVALGYAHTVGSDVSVGFNVQRYTGSVLRELSRSLDGLDLGGAEPFTSSGFWSYSGTALTAGASADVGTVGRLAVSATWSAGLDAEASDDTEGADRSFDMPLELRIGGSAVLTPGLVLAASGVLADWSDINDDLDVPTRVGDTSGFGVGVELPNVRLLGRAAPLRFGYRRNGLPFAPGTSESAVERAFTGGLGFAFNEANGILRAGADLALERGERTAGSIVERFWRATASIRVAGF